MTPILFVLVLQLASAGADNAGECASLAGNEATLVLEKVDSGLDDTITLLQQPSKKHPHRIVSHRPKANDFKPNIQKEEVMLQSLEELVQSVKHGKKAVNVSELAIIKDMVEELMPSVTDAHAQATSALAESIERVTACVNETEVGLTRASETETSTTELGETHHSCRVNEKSKAAAMTQKCDALDTFLHTTQFPAIPNPVTLDALEPVLNEYKRLAGVLQDKKHACNNATLAHDEQKSVCDGDQANYEARFCEYRIELTTLKEDSSTCYADAKSSYDEISGATPGHVDKFRAQMKAFKKILCYLQVWLSSNTIDAAVVQQCEDTSIDTSDMNIVDPGIPAETLVDDSSVAVFPGASEWTDRYQDIPYNSELIHCEAGTTTTEAPTTTTQTTTTTTPADLRIWTNTWHFLTYNKLDGSEPRQLSVRDELWNDHSCNNCNCQSYAPTSRGVYILIFISGGYSATWLTFKPADGSPIQVLRKNEHQRDALWQVKGKVMATASHVYWRTYSVTQDTGAMIWRTKLDGSNLEQMLTADEFSENGASDAENRMGHSKESIYIDEENSKLYFVAMEVANVGPYSLYEKSFGDSAVKKVKEITTYDGGDMRFYLDKSSISFAKRVTQGSPRPQKFYTCDYDVDSSCQELFQSNKQCWAWRIDHANDKLYCNQEKSFRISELDGTNAKSWNPQGTNNCCSQFEIGPAPQV